MTIFLTGLGLTGMICWASIIPVDVLKSRYQTGKYVNSLPGY